MKTGGPIALAIAAFGEIELTKYPKAVAFVVVKNNIPKKIKKRSTCGFNPVLQ